MWTECGGLAFTPMDAMAAADAQWPPTVGLPSMFLPESCEAEPSRLHRVDLRCATACPESLKWQKQGQYTSKQVPIENICGVSSAIGSHIPIIVKSRLSEMDEDDRVRRWSDLSKEEKGGGTCTSLPQDGVSNPQCLLPIPFPGQGTGEAESCTESRSWSRPAAEINCAPGSECKEAQVTQPATVERASRALEAELPKIKAISSSLSSGQFNKGISLEEAGEQADIGVDGEVDEDLCAEDDCPRHGWHEMCGRRKDMEDVVASIPAFASIPCNGVGGCRAFGRSCGSKSGRCLLHFFGVFDGHGGSQASLYCADRLHKALAAEMRSRLDLESLERSSSSSTDASSAGQGEAATCTVADAEAWWRATLSDSFMLLDYHVTGQCNGGPCCKQPNSNCTPPGSSCSSDESIVAMNTVPCLVDTVAPESTGSTAIVAVVSRASIVVANVGDSRAVLGRGGQTIALSVDHKPERADELARVERAGGVVVCWDGWRVLGVLAMSRAIGDRYLKPFVIAEPEVTFTLRSLEDEFLILASDGLWDVIDNERACEVVRRCMRVQKRRRKDGVIVKVEDPTKFAAATLSSMAYQKGSQDNISVVVIDLKAR